MLAEREVEIASYGPPSFGAPAAGLRRAWPWRALGLQLLSGFACLGYEIVWTQQLGVALGHEYVAVLAVLAAFFGGLGLGSLTLARAAERSTRPALWYVACEASIALWALLLSSGLPAAGATLASWLGPEPSSLAHWSLAFLGPLLLLLPATCAMGATLPAIERAIARGSRAGTSVAALYAANTAGALFGVLGCAFWLVPRLGLAHTAQLCAALNAACALLALALFRTQAVEAPASAVKQRWDGRHALVLMLTGALGIGYEVLVIRVLSQTTENTVYSFALALALYLLGGALGAALYQLLLAERTRRDSSVDMEALRHRLLAGSACACLIGSVSLGVGSIWHPALTRALQGLLGPAAAALGSEALLAAAAFLLPTMAMGALFSQLCVEARRGGVGLGFALAANTLGAALAPLVFGVLLLPALGPKLCLFAVALGYVALVPLAALLRSARDPRIGVLLVCAAALVALAPPFARVDVPAGGRLLRYVEGLAASVSVVEDAAGVATLHINNREQEGSSATLFADARQAWLPLLLHAQPERALFLGLGSGVTAGSASWDPELSVDAVELLPEVASASAHFAATLDSSRAPHVIVADARRYVRSAGPRYDVIVADLFHPARSGSAALYTREHFASVRARLTDDSLFCQWLPLHQLDLDTLRSIVATFLSVYPEARALLATYSLDTPVLGLVARRGEPRLDPGALRRRLLTAAKRARLHTLHLEDQLAVLGTFIAGPSALRRFAAGAPPNADDRPQLAYRAPWATYARDTSARQRLLALLHALAVRPDELLVPGADAPLRARLGDYLAARDRFLAVGVKVRPSSDVGSMLAQVRGPLLQILHVSPDFRPAYDPLLNMAAALTARAAPEARALLAELAAAQPARPEAGRLLEHLSPPGTHP